MVFLQYVFTLPFCSRMLKALCWVSTFSPCLAFVSPLLLRSRNLPTFFNCLMSCWLPGLINGCKSGVLGSLWAQSISLLCALALIGRIINCSLLFLTHKKLTCLWFFWRCHVTMDEWIFWSYQLVFVSHLDIQWTCTRSFSVKYHGVIIHYDAFHTPVLSIL